MQAIVHTKGVVLGDKYVPLELAYCDVTGLLSCFHITSPMNYSKMRKCYPLARPDVEVTTSGGIIYSDVLKYLKDRYEFLQNLFPNTEIVFGYKGGSFQPNILKDAGIRNIMNVEQLGVPTVNRNIMNSANCPLHKGNLKKCALVALNQITHHLR